MKLFRSKGIENMEISKTSVPINYLTIQTFKNKLFNKLKSSSCINEKCDKQHCQWTKMYKKVCWVWNVSDNFWVPVTNLPKYHDFPSFRFVQRFAYYRNSRREVCWKKKHFSQMKIQTIFNYWNDHIFSDTKKQMKDAAANFGMNLFADLIAGKDMKQALTER